MRPIVKTSHLVISLCVACLLFGSTLPIRAQPGSPVARRIPTTLEKHGHVRTDDYFWLKDRDNPEVIKYLEAENAYTDDVMAHTRPLQAKLAQEFKDRIKQTDMSVPYRKDGYYYYTRMEEGREYPIHCRKKDTLAAPEQIMLDANKLAEGHTFFSCRVGGVSSNQHILAYAVDTVGRRFYTIRFKDLSTGESLPDEIRDVTGNVAWANDNRTLFYTRQDPVTLRSHRAYRHTLGTAPSKDDLVFEETDDTFNCYVFKTKSKSYLMIASRHISSTELRYLDANDPNAEWRVFLPRRRNHEYSVDHYQDRFYIRTNDRAKNFRLVTTPVGQTGEEHWKELIPHRDDVLFEGMEIFKDYLVVVERKNGLPQIRVRPWSGVQEHYLDFGEPTYFAMPLNNFDFETGLLRYYYSSLTTPDSVYDYDMATKTKKLLKREEVLGGFDPNRYASERLFARASDGVRVPLSMVYRKGLDGNGVHPLLLEGYGSYGASGDPTFDLPPDNVPVHVRELATSFLFGVGAGPAEAGAEAKQAAANAAGVA